MLRRFERCIYGVNRPYDQDSILIFFFLNKTNPACGDCLPRFAGFDQGFAGQLRDVVLYRRAIAPREVCMLADVLVPGDAPSPCASP